MSTFLMVHRRNASPDSWPMLFGPFASDDEARAYAEDTFPKNLWTTEEPQDVQHDDRYYRTLTVDGAARHVVNRNTHYCLTCGRWDHLIAGG